MSQVPNVCVDVFASIGRMMQALQANGGGQSQTFSHSNGYQPVQPVDNNSSGGTGFQPADWINLMFIAALFFYLIFGMREREPEDEKRNGRNHPANNNNNGPNDHQGPDIY